MLCFDKDAPAFSHERLHAVRVDLLDLAATRTAAAEAAQKFTVTRFVHNAGVIRITVNMVAPGPIGTTAMFEALVPPGSEIETKVVAGIPVGRLGHPRDVANAVMFFADRRSGFVTGQTLYVCGGSSIGTVPV